MKKLKKHNSFCKGFLCSKRDRKFNCNHCHRWVCSICSVSEGKKIYCIDCYLKSFIPNWDKLNKEFDIMLGKKKENIKQKNYYGYKV